MSDSVQQMDVDESIYTLNIKVYLLTLMGKKRFVTDTSPPLPATAQRVSNRTEPTCDVSKLQQLIFTKNVHRNRDEKIDDREAEKKSTTIDNGAQIGKQISIINMEEKKIEEILKVLKENTSNFKGWTYLIRTAEKQNNIDNIRKVYSEFLKYYANCHGYWKKYAEFEKKNDLSKFKKIQADSLFVLPTCVDLWIYYINNLKTIGADVPSIRYMYRSGSVACGFHFCSDQFWNDYIKWETDQNEFFNVFKIYCRLVSIPTKEYLQHFKNFDLFLLNVKFVFDNEMIEYLKSIKILDDGIVLPKNLTFNNTGNLEEAVIKEKLKLANIQVYKVTDEKFKLQQKFEENIKISYFNENKLDSSQIENWKNFIIYEKKTNNICRIICVYERCLMPCAFIELFWLSYLDYVDSLDENCLHRKNISSLYKRAIFFHPKSLELHLKFADHEESQGRFENATGILFKIEKNHATSIEIAVRLIHLYRRKDHETQNAFFERYFSKAKENGYSKEFLSKIAIRYANIVWKHDGEHKKARDIIFNVIHRYQINVKDDPEIYLKFIEIKMDIFPRDIKGVLKEFNNVLHVQGLNVNTACVFASKMMEFIEYNSRDCDLLQKVTNDYNFYRQKIAEAKGLFLQQ